MMRIDTDCSDDRLRNLLGDDEDSLEYRSAAEHVGHCTACQERLAELAADEGAWREAQVMLVDGASDDECPTSANADRPWARRRLAWTESMARQLLSPASHPEMLGRIGRYDVERLIGAGGMGLVFKAFDTELNRPVAVKVLAPYLSGSGAARRRFAREARAAAAVVHEHVVAIHNVETDGEVPFLVMPFVAGESLQQRLDREGPLQLCEVLRIARQTAAGLAAAHAQGLVHRDVKPSNILLEETVDRALLTDFGLARAGDDASLTHTGYHPGTPQYMSPEQARGESVDQRSDLFSLGSVLYTMCTGRAPFRAETSFGVLRRITDEEPRLIREINPDVPEWLCQIVGKLMSKQPDARFESAAEVAVLLEGCLAHVQQPTAVPLPKSRVFPKRTQPTAARPQRAHQSGASVLRPLLAAAFALTMVFAGLLVVLELNKGQLTIEGIADDVPVRIMQGEKVVERLTVTRTGASVRIVAGKYVVEIDGDIDGIEIEGGTVSLQRRGREVVRIVRKPGVARPNRPVVPLALAATFPDHLNVMAVAFSPDGERVISVATEQKVAVRTWDVESSTLQRTAWLETELHGNRFAGTAGTTISANGKAIAAIIDGNVKLWDADTGRLTRTLRAPENKVHPWVVAVSPDGSRVAATGGGGRGGRSERGAKQSSVSVFVWGTESGELVQKLEHGGARQIHCLAFSPDGRLLASGSRNNGAKIWEVASGEPMQTVADESPGQQLPTKVPSAGGEFEGHHAVLALGFAPGGRLLATGNLTGVQLWNVQTGRQIYACSAPYRLGRATLGFSPDGERLMRAAADKSIYVWHTKTGELLTKIESDSNCAAFSPDSRLLAVGLSDKARALKIWRLPQKGIRNAANEASDGRLEAGADVEAKRLQRLQGNWKLIYGEYNGGVLPDDTVRPAQLTVADTEYRVLVADGGIGAGQGGRAQPLLGQISSVNAEKIPHEIDVTFKSGVARGIYLPVGDFLFVAFKSSGDKRVTQFNSPTGALHELYLYKRAATPRSNGAIKGSPALPLDQTELGDLQGDWKLIYGEYNGGVLPDDTIGPTKLTIAKTEYRLSAPQQGAGKLDPIVGQISLQPMKTPSEIDVSFGHQVSRGIYLPVGDFLFVVFKSAGDQRPTQISCPTGSLYELYVFKRPARSGLEN